MAKYKLVAVDMDGTLLNDRSEVSEENARWIARAGEADVRVCLSTGRSFQSAWPYAQQLKLDTPLITVNGSEIWHRPHVLYRRTLMPAATVKRLHALAEQYGVWFWAYTLDQVFNRAEWPGVEAGRHWLKFGFDVREDRVRALIRQEIEGWGGLEITNSSETNLEINPLGVNKGTALQALCEQLGIAMSEVVAVGDSLNDLSAIRMAGLGVAMGNAQPAVKAAADVVTTDNNNHAIARLLEQFVL